MNHLKKRVAVHFILANELFAQRTVYHVPRAGDEARLFNAKIYTIKRVVWVYDEEDHVHSRVNVEIEEVI